MIGLNSGSGCDDLHARRKTELVEQCFAIFPSQAEGSHIGHAETGNDGRKSLGIPLGKLAIHQRKLRPIHQLRQRNFVMKICGDLVGDGFLGYRHGGILHALMAFITGYFSCVSTNFPAWS